MRHLLIASLALACSLSTGCYYGHLASGQWKLLWAREPIDEILADPETSAATRSQLRLVDATRRFAKQIGLRVGDQYTSYVEWPGDRIVTTLVRTHPASLEPVPYWFPIVGHLPYKGYFDRKRAEAEASRLREVEAYDVCVSGVAAYSTLGWLDDPVTTPMLRRGPAILVETLLHELVHATAFLHEEAAFNESVAQFIGQEAAVRFFAQLPREPAIGGDSDAPEAREVQDLIADRRAIDEVIAGFREHLAEQSAGADLGAGRAAAERDTRATIAALPLLVIDADRAAAGARLSNACLALRGTYVRDLPRHAEVLEGLGGDLEAMVARLVATADADLDAEAFYRVDTPGVSAR